MSDFKIRNIHADDREQWDALWQGYIRFYETTMPDANTDVLWQRIHDPAGNIHCRVAADNNGKLIGLVHFVEQMTSWNINPVCYLNDLFVSPDIRGGGIGEGLINVVIDEAMYRGWEEVYWHTQSNNTVARGLYDKITGGTDGFINYLVDTSRP
ncbi:MAG: ribosomal protein S18 acetylase RimI-like enzyme [Planctomycetota bacterium]